MRTRNRIVALALIAGGVLLILLGAHAASAASSAALRFWRSCPVQPSSWLLLVGAATTAVGLNTVWRGRCV